jgi:hydrogenase maturation protein HypF
LRLAIRGHVQGVGFRPFVYRLASALDLAGGVRNAPFGALIEIEGPGDLIRRFVALLARECPAPAAIDTIDEAELRTLGEPGFFIWSSEASGKKTALILPDLATCEPCRAELHDRADRRFGYPFINCMHCGPRFSILTAIPYDRANTTMARFRMCAACEEEYRDPRNRRFHAQPNACPACGPQLELWDATGQVLAAREEAWRRAAAAVRAGRILALKGLGGFHLIAAAEDEAAVQRLRLVKRREEKPFALMAPDLDWIAAACHIGELERATLLGCEAPIVLLRRRARASDIAPSVAPRNPHLGVMLPYTPVHHLLLSELRTPIVATSGNLSDEPICIDEREALDRLRGITDLFLVHDRPIVRPLEDSVVRVTGERVRVLRRARGFAPLPVPIGRERTTVLALGAHLKSAVALMISDHVVIGPHTGDLDSAESQRAHQNSARDLPRLFECAPRAVACDLHPDYASTRLAESLGLPIVRVQHHHAHIAACLAEHGRNEPAMGVAWDGIGLGPDGTLWGGEFLDVTPQGYTRIAHLRPFRLPGGEAAIREPRRSAYGLLHALWGDEAFERTDIAPYAAFEEGERRVMQQMLGRALNAPLTTSMGRLFDVVASLIGLRQTMRYEGQAAMELEYALSDIETDESYPYDVIGPRSTSSEITSASILDWGPLIEALLRDVRAGVAPGRMSARFHNALIEMIVTVARGQRRSLIALSGGCFQNAYLVLRAEARLRQEGFDVLAHALVPPNDGGLALGQAMVAANPAIDAPPTSS